MVKSDATPSRRLHSESKEDPRESSWRDYSCLGNYCPMRAKHCHIPRPPSLEDFRQIAKIQLNCQNFAAVDSLPET